MTVVFLLAVIALLLYLHRPERDCTLSAAALIGAFTWLAIDVHLLRLLQEMFAFAIENWVDVVMGVGALILLIVPAMMIQIAVRGELALTGHSANRRNRVIDKFERRVATLLALGYSRTAAETTALHQMKRDLDHRETRT
ncbi:MAG TPA: hypothetical protein VMI10_13290 [Terriglobales bacterium]|nr:hypothetical protein [Terriglobales bacterium]